MNKKNFDDIRYVYYDEIMWFGAILFAVAVVMTVGVIKSSTTPSPKQKDYILHSITSDGTEFYLYMDEEEYQQWASENYIKIQKLRLEEE